MCFSAEASFVAGAVLSVIGVATIKKVRAPSQILFASIPLIFGIQQISEGFVWLSFINETYSSWQQVSTYTFLIIAQVVWPSWVPVSILLLEKQNGRKKILSILSVIGLLVSFYLASCLFVRNVRSEIIDHHISYTLWVPSAVTQSLEVLYFVSTVVPLFISSVKKMWYAGFAILISYIVTQLFFENYVISVWCFFAAIISFIIFFIISHLRRTSE
jgi:hypothetical protein